MLRHRSSLHMCFTLAIAMVGSSALLAQAPFQAVPYAQPYVAPALEKPTAPQTAPSVAQVPNSTPITPVAEEGELFEPGEVLATVGDQFVLAADVLPHVNQIIASNAGRIPPEIIKEQRRALVAQLTRSHVETKLLYLAFLRKIPADKVKEVRKKVSAAFDEELDDERRKVEKMDKTQQEELVRRNPQVARLVMMMKEKGIWSQRELDGILREYNGSLAQERQFFIEYKLGRAVVSQNIKFQMEVTLDELTKYYQEHQKTYSFPNRAKFEVIAVRIANFATQEEAYNAIAAYGNEVYYGANFGAVAKRSSQGLNAAQGGLHDWTPRGSLVSKTLDDSLFTLEPGKLSPILEDDRYYYILRVIERQAAGFVPFEEVQDEIKENIRKEKIQKQYEQFVQTTRKSINVTTVFDDDPRLRLVVRPEENKKK